jgi:hypothetical protein
MPKNAEIYMLEHTRVGWVNPNSTIAQVDLVGHSWFFKKEWLQYLWTLQPILTREEQLICGEDLGFSCALQKIGINTYIPPHPLNDIEMFGSYPDTAWNYGIEKCAISHSPGITELFNKMFTYYRKEHNFKCILD